MERFVEQSLLYDFYGELLTRHQKEVYEDYVLSNLSLSEIAEERNISRQGVHDLIKRSSKTLEDYESKLHLIEKFNEIKLLVNEINTKTNEDNIKDISSVILEKL